MQTMPLVPQAEVRGLRQQGWQQQLYSILPNLVDSHLAPPPPEATRHGGCSGNSSVFQLVVVFHWSAGAPAPCHVWDTSSWVGRGEQLPFWHDRHPWPILTLLSPQHSNPVSWNMYDYINHTHHFLTACQSKVLLCKETNSQIKLAWAFDILAMATSST